jgi:two-component system, NarL family, nitrate/nitrite response regulator NarP
MPRTAASPAVAPARILIVDDHELMRRGIRNLLESNSRLKVCGEAADGEDGVAKVNDLKPDLVILDLNMRGMNGIDATRFIRRNVPGTKILIYSMHESPQIRLAIQQAGADAFVLKSAPAMELPKMIGILLAADSPKKARAI